ncbi:MAG: flavodoxin [Treponema sp.]
MKKTMVFLCSLLTLLPCAGKNSASQACAQAALSGAKKDAKILVAYFSRADENYGVGFIEKGNTQIIAEFIAEYLKADSFHIETATPYPKSYKECLNVAREEQKKNARPKLATAIPDVSTYDIIFLGYPNWGGDVPMAVYTFLESGNFAGKTIIPFCTHAGSGLSNTVKNIAAKCPQATVLKGFAMSGQTAQESRDLAKQTTLKWLDGIKL